MDIRRITEIGVAVENLDQATRLFVDLLGATAGDTHAVDRYQMRYRMCRIGAIDFELMEPIGDTGVIADFLERRGPGLHHVAFSVDGLASGMAALEGKGVSFVDPMPVPMSLEGHDFRGRPFNGECQIAFSHPRSVLGILLEFIQYPAGYDHADGASG